MALVKTFWARNCSVKRAAGFGALCAPTCRCSSHLPVYTQVIFHVGIDYHATCAYLLCLFDVNLLFVQNSHLDRSLQPPKVNLTACCLSNSVAILKELKLRLWRA